MAADIEDNPVSSSSLPIVPKEPVSLPAVQSEELSHYISEVPVSLSPAGMHMSLIPPSIIILCSMLLAFALRHLNLATSEADSLARVAGTLLCCSSDADLFGSF